MVVCVTEAVVVGVTEAVVVGVTEAVVVDVTDAVVVVAAGVAAVVLRADGIFSSLDASLVKFCSMVLDEQLAPSPSCSQLTLSAILEGKQLIPSPVMAGGQDPHWKYQALAVQQTPG